VFRKILAGTDGSDTATLALDHAADLAVKLDAELTIVSAHGSDASTAESVNDPSRVIAGALLRDAEQRYGARSHLVTRMESGAAAEVLVDLAEREGFDLVVVGNRGISAPSILRPASVPDRVARRAPVAVLVVDTVGGRAPGYRRILAGTDGSSTAEKAVEAAVDLAGALSAELELVAATGSDREGRRILDSVRTRWPDLSAHLVSGEPAEALSNLTKSGEYDLLVLGNKGMAGLRRALGSVPARVLRRAPTSVLIINTAG
jgi:nucleotide-binding universal stress UspA family protein